MSSGCCWSFIILLTCSSTPKEGSGFLNVNSQSILKDARLFHHWLTSFPCVYRCVPLCVSELHSAKHKTCIFITWSSFCCLLFKMITGLAKFNLFSPNLIFRYILDFFVKSVKLCSGEDAVFFFPLNLIFELKMSRRLSLVTWRGDSCFCAIYFRPVCTLLVPIRLINHTYASTQS